MNEAPVALAATERIDERLRLARNLHDTVAQSLIALGFELDRIIGSEDIPSNKKSELRALRITLSETVNQLRDEIYRLREIDLALDQDIATFLRSQLPIEIFFKDDCIFKIHQRYGKQITEFVYLLLELLRNSHKHQGVEQVLISVVENVVLVKFTARVVRDHRLSQGFGMGVVGMQERIRALGCSVNYHPDSLEIL